MALVIGTNCGFVTVAPTSDPSGDGDDTMSTRALALKDTSPSGATKITEIGWWSSNATEEGNFEVGIYDHNVGDDEPENLLSGVSRTNAKGTNAGWKVVTGLNITISPETIYWLGVQLDSTATFTDIDKNSSIPGERWVGIISQTGLPNPWGTSSFTIDNSLVAIYAKIETPSTFALTVTAGENGSAVDETGTSPYEENTVVEILATPDEDYQFVDWTTSDGGSFGNSEEADTTYTMPSNAAEITANFEIIPTPPVVAKEQERKIIPRRIGETMFR